MKLKLSILGILAAILGFIGASTTWIKIIVDGGILGEVIFNVKLEPLEFLWLTTYEE